MKQTLLSFILGLIIICLTACQTPTTPTVLADAFFSCQVLVDVNGNGQVDNSDQPLADVNCGVRDASGRELLGGQTDADGRVFMTAPGGLPQSAFPVTVVVDAPEGFRIVGSSAVSLTTSGSATFLLTPTVTATP